MSSSISNFFSTLKWAVVVVISVFIANAASLKINMGNAQFQMTVGTDLETSSTTAQGRSSGPVQSTPECENANKCPSCGSNTAWTPCCVKNEKNGKSYCSCKSTSPPNTECPQLLTSTIAANGNNGNKNGGPFDLGGPDLEAQSTSIQVVYATGAFTMPDRAVTYSLDGGDLEVSLANSVPTDSNVVVAVTFVTMNNVGVDIARNYLKKLGSEEIIQLLDKEIVQQIARKYSKENCDSKDIEIN